MSDEKQRPLTIRQSKFVAEYLKDRNGTQAAIRAGYPAGTARVSAGRLMRSPRIAELIGEKKEIVSNAAEVDAAFVLRELKNVASQEDVAQSTKVRALELLAKHLGMLEDRISLKTDGLSSEQRAERVAILLERVRGRE